jgi:hypothetical protein
MTIRRILRRGLAFTALFLLVLLFGVTTLVFYPQPLFAEKAAYKGFCIYSDDKIEIEKFARWIDDAHNLVVESELYDSGMVFDVFLAHGNIFNDIESLQGSGPIARATADNIVIKIPIDPSQQVARSSRSVVNISELLAHEIVHVLQARRYGKMKFNPLNHPPEWKLEGYPEYISRRKLRLGSTYTLETEVARYLELERSSADGFLEVVVNHFVPSYYYKGRLMIEYLMERKGMTYDEILEDTRSEEQVWKEMMGVL